MTPNQTQLREAHVRVVYLGLVTNLFVPILFLLGGYGVRRMMGTTEVATDAQTLWILFLVFLALAIVEIPVVFLLRKHLIPPFSGSTRPDVEPPSIISVQARYLVLFAVALSPTVYGFIYYLLGGSFREFVLFAVISLIIFRLVRPSQTYFLSIFGVRPPGSE
jgi:hypothetical protein